MNREDFDPTSKREAHEQLKDGYSEVLKITDDDNLVVTSIFKVRKVVNEVNTVSSAFNSEDMTAFQALMQLEILLGAMNAVRMDIRASIFPKDEKEEEEEED